MLTDQQKQKIAERLFMLAEICQREVKEQTLKLYLRVIESKKLEFKTAIEAIDSLLMYASPGAKFPSLHDLFVAAGFNFNEKENDLDDARDIAARIVETVGTLGRGATEQDLQIKLGEVGLAVIALKGGWSRICETMQVSDERVWEAQFRDLAQSVLHRHRRGVGGTPPDLPRIGQTKNPPWKKFLDGKLGQ